VWFIAYRRMAPTASTEEIPMPVRDTPFAPGTPCWVDLMSSDAVAATAFYTALFGWTADAASEEFGGYVNFSSDGHLVAGMVPAQPGMNPADFWSTYIGVEDIETTTSLATEAGAQVLAAPMKVGEMGAMAVLLDPSGAAVGLWQPGTHTGFGKYNEPGSVTWDEHHSKKFAASSAFYRSVFQWELETMSDTDDFRYTNAKVDGETVAGLMDSASFLPDQVPSHWAVYFSVAEVDATAALLVDLGGSVMRPAEDTPFGRIADVADPNGAPFKLHQAPPDQAAGA
jgi:predicted enzyme related to lactoylglutathione lyase